jgi:SAM-dependent methyltransferase
MKIIKNHIKSLLGKLYLLALPLIIKNPGTLYKGQYYSLNRLAVIRFLEEHAGKMYGKVLDVGSGKWTFPRKLLQDHCQYISTDCYLDTNIDIVSNIQTLTLTFPENEFDFVLCLEVLEHVPRPWLAVKELYSVLKPGGVLLLTTPFHFWLHGNNIYRDYWRFTEEGLRLLLVEEANFKNVHIKLFGHFRFPFNFLVEATK